MGKKVIQVVQGDVVENVIVVVDTAVIVEAGARAEWTTEDGDGNSIADGVDAPEGGLFYEVEGAQIGWLKKGRTLVAPPAPPAPPPVPLPAPSTRRVDIFTRCTEDEAARLSQGIDTAAARTREIINATMRYAHDGEAFSLLKEIAEDVFSATPKRVAEILAPSEG